MSDLRTPALYGDPEHQYLYVGSGDHIVLLCDHDTPKWKNAIPLTPDSARKLAIDLVRMADQSERVPADLGEDDDAT